MIGTPARRASPQHYFGIGGIAELPDEPEA